MAMTSMNTYRIGALAKRVGKTVRTLHFYEELGLLSPAERTKGGFRLYTDASVDRIHWIERLQDLGFSLSDIREFMTEFQGHTEGPAAMESLRTFYVEKLSQTRNAIERMQGLEKELVSSLAYLQACGTCMPSTPQEACASCSEPDHATAEVPAMVAGIANTA